MKENDGYRFENVSPQELMLQINDLIESLSKRIDNLPFLISEEVASSVVGQSYYNYDKSFAYFPTLVLLFREVGASQYPRRSQVKARLNMDNKGVSDSFVQTLRNSCSEKRGFTYTYGKVRANFVSTDKRWKTTVFTSSRDEGEKLLETVCSLVGETFTVKNVSWTEGRERENPFTRKDPLDGINPSPPFSCHEPDMVLHRIVMLVNGVPKPIILMRA